MLNRHIVCLNCAKDCPSLYILQVPYVYIYIYVQVNGQVGVQYWKIMDCLRGPEGAESTVHNFPILDTYTFVNLFLVSISSFFI